MKYKLFNEEHKSFNPFVSSEIRNIIFSNRNITDIVKFVSPAKEDLLDPFDLDNMQEGIDLLFKHIEQNSKILIIVDSDVDGYTSSSVLYNYLKKSYNNIDLNWIVHNDKSHGIDLSRVQAIKPNLVICPDSSSNEYDKHKALKEQNIDVLVLDHHEAEYYSSDAIVINNQLSEKYSNKSLSGAGIVFKFCQAIDSINNTNYAMDFLDLVALGILADMMDVRVMENRYIITQGLQNIKNIFFKQLVQKQQYSLGSQALSPIGVVFYISPLINAVTRVGEKEEKERIFKAFIEGDKMVSSTKRGATKDDEETLAEQATRCALNCKNRQKKLTDEIQEVVQEDIENESLDKESVIIVKMDVISNRSLTGLVANQLANIYKRPVLFLVDQGNEYYAGSGRNYGFSEIVDLKDNLNKTELFEFAEGHQSAFGAMISDDNIDTFKENLDKIFPDVAEIEDAYIVDLIIEAKDLNPNIIKEIAKFRSLWGKGFEEPLIAIKNIPVNSNNFSIMGQKQNHFKFEYKNIIFIKFNASSDEINKFTDKDLLIDVVGRCDVNVWKDNFTYQVIIQNYEIVEEADEYMF